MDLDKDLSEFNLHTQTTSHYIGKIRTIDLLLDEEWSKKFDEFKRNLIMYRDLGLRNQQELKSYWLMQEGEEKEEEMAEVDAIVFSQCPGEKVEEWNLQDPPEEEPQFFTNDPGDKTKERVKELVEEKLNESVLEGRLKEQLKEVVRSRVDAFLTKGDPIERIVNHYHEIETI